MSRNLTDVEAELRETAINEVDRLEALLLERGELLAGLDEGVESLLGHLAAGQELADRLLRERSRLVEAWGDSARERQMLRMFEGQSDHSVGFAELG